MRPSLILGPLISTISTIAALLLERLLHCFGQQLILLGGVNEASPYSSFNTKQTRRGRTFSNLPFHTDLKEGQKRLMALILTKTETPQHNWQKIYVGA